MTHFPHLSLILPQCPYAGLGKEDVDLRFLMPPDLMLERARTHAKCLAGRGRRPFESSFCIAIVALWYALSPALRSVDILTLLIMICCFQSICRHVMCEAMGCLPRGR